MNGIDVNRTNNGNNPQKPMTLFDVLHSDYKAFLKKMEKSDFKNTSSRYITELNYLKQLLKQAQQQGLEQEASNVKSKMDDIRQTLKENFGIVMN